MYYLDDAKDVVSHGRRAGPQCPHKDVDDELIAMLKKRNVYYADIDARDLDVRLRVDAEILLRSFFLKKSTSRSSIRSRSEAAGGDAKQQERPAV